MLSKKLEILQGSLLKKEKELNSRLEAVILHQKITNGQPMNDKRNGASWFKKKEKLDNSIRNLMVSIEKTKVAIEKEQAKLAGVAKSRNYLPKPLLDAIADGLIVQWRKYPNRFFVIGVEKARLIWNKKKGKLQCCYTSEIPNEEQFKLFKDVALKIDAEIDALKNKKGG